MRTQEPMSAEDLQLVAFFVREELKWGLQCLALGAFVGLGYASFTYLSSDPWEYSILLAVALVCVGLAVRAFRKWSRGHRDMRDGHKDVWTTSDFQHLHHEMEGLRSGRLQRYHVRIDGRKFVVLHDHLEAIGWDNLVDDQPTRVEVTLHLAVFLRCAQP